MEEWAFQKKGGPASRKELGCVPKAAEPCGRGPATVDEDGEAGSNKQVFTRNTPTHSDKVLSANIPSGYAGNSSQWSVSVPFWLLHTLNIVPLITVITA